jgi:tripeptide aminopeptidase
MRLKSSVVDRFLRYVTFDTRSDESSAASPSTPGQMVLLEHLAGELRAMGLEDVDLDRRGVLMATVPAAGAPDASVIGLIAHVDTSPEMSGAGVKPIVHRAYDGRDLVLPDDPTAVLRAADVPALGQAIGHDLITASGATLLGADDKAGVAAIVAAAELLMAHPEIPHGRVRLAFTTDEEIGRGTAHFDVARFGAACAYTLDGGGRGEIESESFSADQMTVAFRGFNTHPGYAKGRMVNAIKMAADFIARLPKDGSPETTDRDEGFVHPYVMDAGVDRTTVKLIVRDFHTDELARKEARLEALARATADAFPGGAVETAVVEQYRNMKEVLDRHPQVVANAMEAVRRAGLTPEQGRIRGGTDGSRLSFMGLPCPNIFAGEHAIHSRLEWVSVQDMQAAVRTIVHLAMLWEEQA